ncbi:MAG: tetratricopeptide repeat protein, partial [Synechococcales bacterium]|nr:tetratricopeptide repeat protein [Synechococcales bacterium]
MFEEDGAYYNVHTFEGQAGQSVAIELISDEFDTHLLLQSSDGALLNENNDGEDGTNSFIAITLPTTGPYRVLVKAYREGETGPYALTGRSASNEDISKSEVFAEVEQLSQEIIELGQQGQYGSAIPLAQRALGSLEQVLGNTHLRVADLLKVLGILHRFAGEYAIAEPLYQRALVIEEASLDEDDSRIAGTLNALANLYQLQGSYMDAEPLFQRALAIRETALGRSHPDVASSLGRLAELYILQGNFTAAKPLLERSLSIYETALGESDPRIAVTLSRLALLYIFQGNLSGAEPLLQRALSIYEADEGSQPTARALLNLAELYRLQGKYSAAEPLLQRSLSILELTLGRTHPDVATALNTLAALYQNQGNYTEAQSLYQRSLAIRETALGENHPDVATSLNNLAALYLDQGNYAAAEPLYRRSLSIFETVLGENHPDVASSLNNLAVLYYAQGNYAAAEPLFQRSLAIRETALGENHPDVAISLTSLAVLYHNQGNYAAAEPLLLRSLAIWETALGENHPDVAFSLNNLAGLYQAQGNDAAALPLLERAAESREVQLALTLTVVSEERRRAYLTTLAGETNGIISFNLQDIPEATSLALTTLLRRKGRVLDATAESFQALREQLTPENQALLDELRAVETQRANLVFGEPVEGHAELLSELEARTEELQNTLARRSAEFRAETQPVTIAAIQQQIPADAALVELVRYEPFNAGASQQERWGAPRYAAYVLLPSGEILTVDLGDAAALEAQVFAFREVLRNPNSNIQPLARELDAQLMQPIRELVGDATHLLMSPDGALNLIPFAALMDESNTYLAERYTFTYLTSGRDLLRMQRETEPGQGPVIVANPDYGATEIAAASRGLSPVADFSGAIASAQRSSDFGSLNAWAPLPGTEQEMRAIAPLLPNPQILDGVNATEDAVKQVARPSILHIATHGFFLQDQDCLAAPDTRSGREAFAVIESTAPADCVPTPRNVENPLLRSGLVFAGVNEREQLPEGSNDAVLTAQEVTQMNLYGTQLVVLSACETGLGNVVNGDGVYGLRRAFVLAGAESQLMSLWKVDDFGTSQLMGSYYQRLMAGAGRSEALRDVQRELMQTGA